MMLLYKIQINLLFLYEYIFNNYCKTCNELLVENECDYCFK